MSTVPVEHAGKRAPVAFLIPTMLGLPLIYIGTLYATQFANVAVACVLALAVVWAAYKWTRTGRASRETVLLLFATCPLAVAYVVSMVANGAYTADSLKTLAQLWLVVLFLCHCLDLPPLDFSLFHRSAPAITLLVFLPIAFAFIYVAKVAGDDGLTSAWTRVKNTIAAVALLLTVVNYLVWRHARRGRLSSASGLLACAVMLACVYASGSRGAALSLVTMICVSASWPHVRHKWLYLAAAFVIIPAVIYLYIQLPSMDISSAFSNVVRQSTGENLYSGRQLIWPSIVNSVSSNAPWLGFGPDATAKQAMLAYDIHRNWSAHDLYLQVLLQGGWVGIAALSLLVGGIWHAIRRVGRRTGQARFACAFFIGLLVYDTFEVTLLQNNLSTGLALWIALALVLNAPRQEGGGRTDNTFTSTNLHHGVSDRDFLQRVP